LLLFQMNSNFQRQVLEHNKFHLETWTCNVLFHLLNSLPRRNGIGAHIYERIAPDEECQYSLDLCSLLHYHQQGNERKRES
jgi:hypothetical protein